MEEIINSMEMAIYLDEMEDIVKTIVSSPKYKWRHPFKEESQQ